MMLFTEGVLFNNKIVSQEEWPTLKQDSKRYPTASLPVVSIKGIRYYETIATLRSLALGLGIYEPVDYDSCYVHDCIMDEYSAVIDKSGAMMVA